MRIRDRITALITAFVLLATLLFPLRAEAAGGVILKLHYERTDANYEGWDVWLWPAGGEGAGYAFAKEGEDMVATMEVPAGTVSIGYIVRTQDWTKDINMDQFIDIAEVVSGTVHVYVKSGVEGCTKVYGDDVVIGTKLRTAAYSDEDCGIKLEFTGELNEEQKLTIEVNGTDGAVPTGELTYLGDFKYMLKLLENLNLARRYTLKYDGDVFSVNMPIVYSTAKFEEEYTYTGNDLGSHWTKEATTFKLWAPTAEEAFLNRYESGSSWKSDLIESIPMEKSEKGTWTVTVNGDISGTYYTFSVMIDKAKIEANDPYAVTTGYNGRRAMVTDLDSTDPEGWESDKNPHAGESITDAVIYELHIRDFSQDGQSGMENKGKYIAFTETGTKTPGGVSTGVDYLKDLGITHVHLLPFYDYGSVDEVKLDTPQFNWGYDPVNYNVPEGSYSTDPSDGYVRIKEAKQMVKALHDAGISVVMDVVYNHVYSAGDYCFNRLVPGYFSRINANGSYSNGSGCGNDTASERSMVRKFIVDSVNYWAEEYHIDGFRFDLVGLLDTETMNQIIDTVHEKHPDVIFYGEGWIMNTDVTKEGLYMATQRSSARTPGLAFFNDNMRDGLKGSVFNEETGFVSGAKGRENGLINSFMAQEGWSSNPSQIINYASCHDNMTLIDRINVSRPDASMEDLIRMNNLAAAIYMTAEGTPFMQAGEEILRTKVKADGTFDSNSYSSPDSVNSISWSSLEEEDHAKVHDYYKGLIAFRKSHALLRLTDTQSVKEHVKSVDTGIEGLIAFEMTGGVNGVPEDQSIFLAFNAGTEAKTIELPEGKWSVYVNDTYAGDKPTGEAISGTAEVKPISALVLVKGEGKGSSLKGKLPTPLMIAVPVGIALVAGLFSFLKRRKK